MHMYRQLLVLPIFRLGLVEGPVQMGPVGAQEELLLEIGGSKAMDDFVCEIHYVELKLIVNKQPME